MSLDLRQFVAEHFGAAPPALAADQRDVVAPLVSAVRDGRRFAPNLTPHSGRSLVAEAFREVRERLEAASHGD